MHVITTNNLHKESQADTHTHSLNKGKQEPQEQGAFPQTKSERKKR